MSTTTERVLFLKKYVTNLRGIASVTPSSRAMATAMTDDLSFRPGGCIVELGAGTGPVTAMLLKRNAGRSRIVIVEKDPDFCAILRQKFPGEDIVEGSALDIETILAQRGIAHADHIVSCLGVVSFPEHDRSTLIRAMSRALAPGGTIRQLTEIPLVFFPFYKRYFASVRFRFVPRNIPPGGVYVLREPRI